jgi:type I restriction enzyme, S subunit
MVSWAVKTLGEVCTFKPPKGEARAKLSDDDEVSFAPMEDLGIGVKYLQTHRTRKLGEVSGSYTYFADGDVLLAKITPCFENGKLGVARDLTNGAGFGSSEYIVLRPTASLDAEFLYYYLARPVFLEEGARHMAGAVGHKRVTKEFVESYPIPLPPLPEQQRIVAILDEAFEGIATAKANAEKNLRNARELFDTKMELVFLAREKDWVSTKLGSAFRTLTGNTPSKANAANFGTFMPLVKPPELLDDYVDDAADGLSQSGALVSRVLPVGSVLVSCIGNLGKIGINSVQVACNQQINAILPDENKAVPEFMFFQALARPFKRQLEAAASGTTVPIVNKSKFNEIEVFLPSLQRQHEVVGLLRSLRAESDRLVALLEQKVSALDELKKSLLHQAFTGQL